MTSLDELLTLLRKHGVSDFATPNLTLKLYPTAPIVAVEDEQSAIDERNEKERLSQMSDADRAFYMYKKTGAMP